MVPLDYEGEGCWIVNICFALWRVLHMVLLPVFFFVFVFFACAVPQSERSSELVLQMEVMSI